MADDWAGLWGRTALCADLMILFGLVLFRLHALRDDEPRAGALIGFDRWVRFLALGGLGLSAVMLVLAAASMSGVSPTAVDLETLRYVLLETNVGASFLTRAAALLLALVVALIRLPATPRLWLLACSAGVALASLAVAGHAAATEGLAGWIHLSSDMIHLLAAGAWLGAIFAFALLLWRQRASPEHIALSHRCLAGFANLGSVLVLAILATGIVNAAMLVEAPSLRAIAGSRYLQLLCAKIALFLLMLAIAAANRFRLTPRLARQIAAGDRQGAVSALRISVTTEGVAAAAILMLAAWLGSLDPNG